MKMKKALLATATTIPLVILVPVAHATNGLAPIGLGQIHKAMGGAAVGNPQNTTTMMTNPAAASFIADGYDVGGEIFQPKRTTISSLPAGFGPGGTEYNGDKSNAYFIPEAAYKRDKGRHSLGFVLYGNGGMNTSYENSPVFPTGAPAPNDFAPFNGGAPSNTGIDLKQIFLAPTISTKLNDKHSVGLSVNLVLQRFHAEGIQAFQGDPRANPADLKAFQEPGTDSSHGVGATIGWMGEFSDNFTMGASYRFKTDMSKFDKYSGLFEGGGDLDVPGALTIGASVKVTPKTTFAVDVQKIYYSDVDAIGNSVTSPTQLGSSGGPGFGWEDQTIFKIGMKTQATSKLAIMAGYNHGSSPVGPEDTFFGVLAPAVTEDHLSVGFEYTLGKKSTLIGTYRHAFKNTVNGDANNPFNLEMEQNAIGLAYSKKF